MIRLITICLLMEIRRKANVLQFLKKNAKGLLLAASLLLNVLGGSGVIPPVVAKVGNAAIEAAK